MSYPAHCQEPMASALQDTHSAAADMQAMAGSAYKDSALGDSVKVLNPIEDLITSFGTGQPMVFQVRCLVHHLV